MRMITAGALFGKKKQYYQCGRRPFIVGIPTTFSQYSRATTTSHYEVARDILKSGEHCQSGSVVSAWLVVVVLLTGRRGTGGFSLLGKERGWGGWWWMCEPIVWSGGGGVKLDLDLNFREDRPLYNRP